jgi:glycerophosphoryl diester phosphodiesterase
MDTRAGLALGQKQALGRKLVLSHRGIHGGAEPENSVAAFSAAVAMGVEGIELDVRRTADGVLVIAHDAMVGGLTVADCTHAELAAGVPTLCTFREALSVIPPGCVLDVEIKLPGIEAEVLRELATGRQSGAFVVSSFHDGVVARVKQLDPSVKAGLILGEGRPKDGIRSRLSELFPTRRLGMCRADFVVPHWRLLRFGFLRRVARHGCSAWVWTVNEPRRTKRLFRERALAAIVTDRPLEAMRLRANL